MARTPVSKTVDAGSSPARPANDRFMYLAKECKESLEPGFRLKISPKNITQRVMRIIRK